ARGGLNDRCCGGSGDVEGVLELLHELAELEEGHLLERVEQLVGAELRHDGVLSLLPGKPAVGCDYSAGSAGVSVASSAVCADSASAEASTASASAWAAGASCSTPS